jgi:hypothetical protein
MGRYFLASFHPLIRTSAGRRAAERHGIPPFVDGSCRREPDFESAAPAITAICRGRNFAPRLKAGDRIAYITVKGRYLEDVTRGWRLVALLKVVERFESHEEAASWYTAHGLALPNNCLVPGNNPLPFASTHQQPRPQIRARAEGDPERIIRLWDAGYKQRVAAWPVLFACKAKFLDLKLPPQLQERDMLRIFGREPPTRTPPTITARQFRKLLSVARRAARP